MTIGRRRARLNVEFKLESLCFILQNILTPLWRAVVVQHEGAFALRSVIMNDAVGERLAIFDERSAHGRQERRRIAEGQIRHGPSP